MFLPENLNFRTTSIMNYKRDESSVKTAFYGWTWRCLSKQAYVVTFAVITSF